MRAPIIQLSLALAGIAFAVVGNLEAARDFFVGAMAIWALKPGKREG